MRRAPSVPATPRIFLPLQADMSSGLERAFPSFATALADGDAFPDHRINSEDFDYLLRLGTALGFVQIDSPPTFAYRQHAISSTRNCGARTTVSGICSIANWKGLFREAPNGVASGLRSLAE